MLAALLTATPFNMDDVLVIVIGVSLVLAILVVLTIIITLEGKLFRWIDKKKKGAKQASAPAKSEKVAAVPAAPVQNVPYIGPDVSPQVIAAIAAAVASMEDGKFELRSVTRAKGAQNVWNTAGTAAYTEPF